MKFVFLVGGLTGFLTATLAGWAANRAPDGILLEGMFGAIVGAFLFRWFWSVVLQGLRETLIARQRAAQVPTEAKKKT